MQLNRKVCACLRKNYYTIPQTRYPTVHSMDYDTRMNNVDANADEFASIGEELARIQLDSVKVITRFRKLFTLPCTGRVTIATCPVFIPMQF